jgi:exodeoxyribonuclease X
VTTVLMRVVDFETTGLAPPEAEILEVGTTDVWFDTEARTCAIADPQAHLFGTTRPIPPEASAVHHIVDEDVAGLPPCTIDDLRTITTLGAPFAVVAHNWAYEGQWLAPEVLGDVRSICTFKAALRAWEEAPGHSNATLRYWRGLRLDHRAMPPHRAGPDAYVTAHLLADLLKTESVRDLVRWTQMPRHYRVCPIGKWRGHLWAEIPHDYLKWVAISATDMAPDIKAAALAELERRQGA